MRSIVSFRMSSHFLRKRLLVFATPLFLHTCLALSAAESSLAIANAGMQSAEDSAFVAADYKFLPGEPIYATFEVGGFKVDVKDNGQDNPVRSISLRWEVTVLDAENIPLTEPAAGEIKTELSPEDKNWAPKRRVSFSLPSFVAAGEFHLHIVVKDLLGNVETSKDLPFEIGGTRIQPTKEIEVEHLRFSRKENGPALDVAAFRPGDPIFVHFDIVGFSNAAQNEYHLSYGVTVLRPDGKPFLENPDAAQLTSSPFYPAKFIPANVEITTSPSNARGAYVLIVTVRDLIANRTTVTKQSFSLE
jgi:hypothetical protein